MFYKDKFIDMVVRANPSMATADYLHTVQGIVDYIIYKEDDFAEAAVRIKTILNTSVNPMDYHVSVKKLATMNTQDELADYLFSYLTTEIAQWHGRYFSSVETIQMLSALFETLIEDADYRDSVWIIGKGKTMEIFCAVGAIDLTNIDEHCDLSNDLCLRIDCENEDGDPEYQVNRIF